MKYFLLILLLCPISVLFAQNQIRKTTIDINTFRSQLLASPSESIIGVGKVQQSTNIISLPFPDGTSGNFQLVEYNILPKGVDTDIKTYYGQKADDASVSCRISITKDWIVATIYTEDGIIVIERSKQSTNINEYDVYLQTQNDFECKAENNINGGGRIRDIDGILNYTNGSTLRTYRMAFIVTNEFYVARGNTNAAINAEITAIVNSLNGLYEKEIAVRLSLVSPNNPASANVFYRKTTDINTYYQDIDIIRVEMNTRYGAANYDLGHCLHTDGGGVAYYGVCNDTFKGGAWSGSTIPSSVLLMAHEVGHQFTAPHTFLGNGSGNCNNDNRNLPTAFEPGSGSTIMSYAGLCGTNQNLTGGKVPYFHTNSLQNMISYIQTGTGNTCGIPTATGNTPPVSVAGATFTIPKNTPFTLIGTGSDANGDVLTYTWEEYDLPVANDVGALGSATNGVGGYPAINSITAPLFRSKQSGSSERVFPSLSGILNNGNNPPDTEGEDLPNVSRTMNFRLTVRDNRAGGGGTHCSEVVITVDATKGPLAVTLPNGGETWAAGNTQTINWSVNNTNTMSANVDVYLSVDGGNTFPYLIISNTPNDGTQTYLVSANISNTTQARVKIVSRGSSTSNFFDVSNANFTLTSTCQPVGSIFCSDATVSAQSGNASLNLGLAFTPVSKFTGSSKNFSATGAVSRTIVGYSNETLTTCQNIFATNSILVSFRVGKTGTYTISGTGDSGSKPFSIFSTNTFNCSNFVSSNAYDAGGGFVSWEGNRTITLNACTTYYLLLFTFGSTNVTLNIEGVGDVYEVISNPSGYSYTYIALNTSNNLVSSQSSTSNFTTLPAGTFDVYGVMYKNGVVPSSFVGQSLNTIISSNCLLFSDNKKRLNISSNPNPCSQTVTLVNPTHNISSGNITKQASAINGTITASNYITGAGTRATYQAKSIQLNVGFKADKGTIFKAEIGGCN